MVESGLFVTLYDKDTLKLYLTKGIYGTHMRPIEKDSDMYKTHYPTLADFACTRNGTHVFFFLKREIIYGGQIKGNKNCGSYYLNGPYSPMGKKVNSKVIWDESKRDCYISSKKVGQFKRARDLPKVCQPYLIRFEDKLGLKGNTIASDQLYFELGEFPYPLPSNAISGMSFCTITPGEAEIALRLLKKESIKEYKADNKEEIILSGKPKLFKPEFGISQLNEAINEAHLEASIIANPKLLNDDMQPKGAAICRQVPISPFKPAQMDKADICYFGKESIRKGTVPNTIIELKYKPSGTPEIRQIEQYLKWLHKRLKKDAYKVRFFLFAPSFKRNISINSISKEYRQQVQLIGFNYYF